MFEIRPVLYFLRELASSCGVGLLERRASARRESGRKPEREGSSGQPRSLGDLDGRAAQDLGVELVGAALDLALDLVEEREQPRRGRS